MFLVPVQAQTTSEFGYQLHPEKLLENTEATLQVFVTSNEMMVPKQIENLKIVSSDNEIIQVLGVEETDNKFTKNVLIKANKPGIASIALAASSFSSKEISLEVFNNNNHPTQILMKITPDVFPIDGPRYGHIAVELATTGGLPTLASEDVTISLDTPNKDVIKIKNTEVIISSGEYYATTEFEIVGSGDAIIFADTEGMEKISDIVNVLEPEGPLKLQLYAIPNDYNSYSGAKGVVVVQLLDDSGDPVIAEEDIHFELNVENPNSSVNTSYDFEEVDFETKQLVIEKGSYSTFTKFTPRPNLGDYTGTYEQTYNIFISVEGYQSQADSITVNTDRLGEVEGSSGTGALEGRGPAVTQVLPFLTTGEEEVIAVTYYQTQIDVSRQTGGSTQGVTNREFISVTVPVQASDNHEIVFSSSELDTVNPKSPLMNKGENVVVVFGETGTVVSEDSVIFSIIDNEGVKTVGGIPIGPIESDMQLVVEPLLPMILAEKEFPVLAYLNEGGEEEEGAGEGDGEEESEGDPRLGVTPFIEDAILTFSANEFVETDSITIKQNQPYSLTNMMSKELGETELSYQMGGFDGTAQIVSHTTDPSEIYLAFPKNILANSETLATVQVLDSVGNPVYAKKDIEIKLVSNDDEILKVPQELTIKEGDYFTTFALNTENEGEIELALLSEDFALSKYDINVVDITPTLSLELLGEGNWNERVEAKLSVSIPEITTALDGFVVEWESEGGEVRSMDKVTNKQGIASMNVIANDKETISITATVSGNGFESATASKSIEIINKPVVEAVSNVETVTETPSEFPLDSTAMVFIIIPVAVGGALFFLKRMDKLDLITEKIPIGDKLNIGDKVEEIKEKISDIRNR
jgi:hypothetical protein